MGGHASHGANNRAPRPLWAGLKIGELTMAKTVRVYGTVTETIEREVVLTVEVPAAIEACSMGAIAGYARMSAESYVADGFDPAVVKEETLHRHVTNDCGESTFSVTDVDFSGLFAGTDERSAIEELTD